MIELLICLTFFNCDTLGDFPQGDMSVYEETIEVESLQPRRQLPQPVYNPPTYTGNIPDLITRIWQREGLGDQASRAVRVSFCESTHRPGIVNPYGYSGLFQLGTREWQTYGAGGNPLNAEDNIMAAIRLYKARSWQPWVCQ